MERWSKSGVRGALVVAAIAAMAAVIALGAAPASAELPGDTAVVGVIRGYISTADGARSSNDLPPVAPATRVDLHRQDDGDGRGELVRSLTTRNGRYAFAAVPGCYVVVVNAPDGYTFRGQPTGEQTICIDAGQERWVYTHIVDATVEGVIQPQSTLYSTKVDIFEARADGSRGRFLNSTTSSSNVNSFSFDLRPGCYVLTFIAPEGTSFAGRRWFQPGFCVEAGDRARVDADLLLSDPLGLEAAADRHGAAALDQRAAAELVAAAELAGDNPAFEVLEDRAEQAEAAANAEDVLMVDLRGYVRRADGTGVADARVVVFEQVDHRLRGREVVGNLPFEFGEFTTPSPVSCYVLVFIAPDGAAFDGSRFAEFPFCNGSGRFVLATLDAETPAIIGGRVTRNSRDEDQVVPEIGFDLYEAVGPDERGPLVDSTVTINNRYSFGVEPGCYIIEPVLPAGFRIHDDNINHDFYSCVEDGDINLHVHAKITTDPGRATITGTVTSVDGPERDVRVELYQENAAGERGQLIVSAQTASHNGQYAVVAVPGCYVLVIPAPPGREFIDGSAEFAFSTCLVHGQYVANVDAVLAQDTMPPASFGGVVTTADGDPVGGMKITLWYANQNGRRGQFVEPGFTDNDGRYWFVGGSEQCYWMVYIAPDGASFNGGRFLERKHCVPSDETPFHDIDVALD